MDNVEVCLTHFLHGPQQDRAPAAHSNVLIAIPTVGFSLFPASLSPIPDMCFLKSTPKHISRSQDHSQGLFLAKSKLNSTPPPAPSCWFKHPPVLPMWSLDQYLEIDSKYKSIKSCPSSISLMVSSFLRIESKISNGLAASAPQQHLRCTV